MRISSLLLPISLLVAASAAAQEPGSCAAEFASRGNPLSGRSYTAARDFAGVSAEQAFILSRQYFERHAEKVLDLHGSEAEGIVRVRRGERPERAIETEIRITPGAASGARVAVTDRFLPGMLVQGSSVREVACAYFRFLETGGAGGGRLAGAASPPAAGGAVQAGQEVRDEAEASRDGVGFREAVRGSLAGVDEIDRYRLRDAKPGDTVVVVDPNAPGSEESIAFVALRIRDAGGRRTIAGVLGSSPVVLAGTGPFEVLVEPKATSPVPRRYRLQVFRHTQAPDRVPARITLGQTVQGEAIDYLHDVDEYLMEGIEGQELDLVVAGSGVFPPPVELLRLPGDGSVQERVNRVVRPVGGIYRITASGTYRVVVGGTGSFGAARSESWVGPYTLRVRDRS